jgi:hypothetical protein
MNIERYQTIVSEDVLTFEFISVGPKGNITKNCSLSTYRRKFI